MWTKFKDILASLSPQEQKPTPVVLNQSRRFRALDSVSKLQKLTNGKFSYQKASSTNCKSCQSNLIALYTHLVEINEVIKSGKALSPVDFTCTVSEYTVSDLLINDGMFIPLDIVDLFCNESIKLCKTLKDAENHMAGTMAYNLRVLAVQLGSIREVSNALITCYKK